MLGRHRVATREPSRFCVHQEPLVGDGQRTRASAPRGEDEREPRPLHPRLPEIEHVREAPLDRERRVTDDERPAFAMRVRDRIGRGEAHETRLATLAPRSHHEPRENDAGARGEIERELVDLVDGALGDDDDAPYRPSRADRDPANETEIAKRRGSSDGHQRDVRFVLRDPPSDLRRQREPELDRCRRQRLVERPRVEILHGGNAQRLATFRLSLASRAHVS